MGLARNLSKFKPNSDGLVEAGDIAEGAVPQVDLESFADGDAGEPKISGKAIKKLADFSELTVTSTPTYTVSTTAIGTQSTTDSSYVTSATITLNKVAGSITVRATHYVNDASQNVGSYMRFLKNGTQFAEFYVLSQTQTVQTATTSVVSSDVITVQHRMASAVGVTSICTSSSALASNAYTTRTPVISQLDNL